MHIYIPNIFALDCLISETQSGFIKGRFIGENTRFIYDICRVIKISGLLVLIDFEKALNSIAWEFIYKVLNFKGFGKK